MKKFILCLAVAVVAAAITFLAMTYVPQWTRTRGFDTPEACALALFDAIKAQDVKAMEDCLAFDEMAENFDYQKYSERMRTLMDTYFLPANNPVGAEYNRSHIRELWYKRLLRFTFSIVNPDLAVAFDTNKYIYAADDAFNAMLESITAPESLSVLDTLEYQGMMMPDQFPDFSEKYYSEMPQSNLAQTMAFWGVDTYEELAIQLHCPEAEAYWGSTDLLMPLRLVEINGRWLADPTGSNLGYFLWMNVNDLVVVPE